MEVFLILFLIALNGVFAMSEIALISAKKTRLQQIAEDESILSHGAKTALGLQENPRVFLSTIQVGITSVSILSGIVGEKSLVDPLSTYLISIGFEKGVSTTIASFFVIMTITFLSVIFGEIIPKSIALSLSDKVASVLSVPMSGLAKITFPFVWLFTTISEMILKVFRINKFENIPVSNEEIKELMGQGTEAGVFHESEKAIVANVLHMDEKSAVSIMTHRGEWKFIDLSESFAENRKKIIENKLLNILVVDGDINNILGFVDLTNILYDIIEKESFDIRSHIETPLYLPQTVTVSQVLENFKTSKKDVSIIINEYGENIGIVSLKDIMSSIVGEIEKSSKEEDKEIIMREDGSFIVDGLIALDKLFYELEQEKVDYPSGINTLSGLVMANAGKVPNVGYTFDIYENKYTMSIEVLDMDKNCVDKVLVKITPKDELTILEQIT